MDKALAHISEDGTRTQTVYEHLSGTARLAGAFAAPFGAAQEAEYAAWLHDIGKYSAAFQQRLAGGCATDHSTAGAQEAMKGCMPHVQAAFAVAGHHTGLPDGGNRRTADAADATLFGRLKKPVEPTMAGGRSPCPRAPRQTGQTATRWILHFSPGCSTPVLWTRILSTPKLL